MRNEAEEPSHGSGTGRGDRREKRVQGRAFVSRKFLIPAVKTAIPICPSVTDCVCAADVVLSVGLSMHIAQY